MLTFEKDPFQGTQSILEKLTVGPSHRGLCHVGGADGI